MRKMSVFVVCTGFVVFGAVSWGDKYKQRGKKSHIHGRGHMDVILLQGKMVVSFRLPAHNIVGFERDPKRPEQKRSIAKAAKLLKDYQKTIALPSAGGCQPSAKAKVVTTTRDRDGRNKHTDFQVKYEFNCATPAEVKFIEVLLFKIYEGFTHLDARWITQNKQFQQDLTLKNNIFRPGN